MINPFLVHLEKDDVFSPVNHTQEGRAQKGQHGKDRQHDAHRLDHAKRPIPIAITQIQDGTENQYRNQNNVKEDLEHRQHNHRVGDHIEFVFPSVFAILTEAHFRSFVVVADKGRRLHGI